MPLFKKKAEMPTPEEIEAGKVKSYKDLIAPSVVSFRRSPGYYILGNTYRCVWAIRSYAETVEKDSPEIALLRELGESDGITLHIYTRHMPTVERDEIFHRAQNRTNMQKRSSYKLHEQIEADEQLTTLSRMIRETQRTKETFVYCAVFIELIADSLEHLQSKQIETQSILTHHKILVDKLYLRQLQGFESVKPNGKNAFSTEFERVFPASSVANLFPFSYSGKNDKNGFYIGRDQNGSNIIVDFDRRAEDKTNGHILILGNSGEGKSYLMKLIITNVIMAGKKVYILDPDNEYGELVKNLGGTYLDMMDSKYYINVLEPKTWVDPTQEINEFDDSPEAFKKQNRLSQHIAYLRDFFSVYQDFSSAQLDIIEIMLEETYKRRGITPRTDFTKLTSEDYPILSDLYRVIEEKLESYDEEAALAAKAGHPVMYSLEMLKSVGLGLRGICIGAMSRYFNGHTNIPNSNFIDFCVKDALTTNDNLKNAMFLNLIYQDKQGNIVFVCYDCFGRVKSAHKRGTNSAQRYRSFVTGGEFNCGFSYANDNATVLYVFEAPIDLMSFLTLHRHKPWHRASYLSLGGLSEDPLRRFLKEHKSIQRIAFCFDNDINKPENRGQEAAKRFMRQFSGKYITSILCPCKKDWNDVLRDKIQKGEFL